MLKKNEGCSQSSDMLYWVPAVLVMTIAAVITLLPLEIVTVLFEDDSFFYVKTANNIASGLGSTFDGINKTNGYHPLYMVLLTLVAFFVPLTGTSGVYAVCVVDSLLFAAFLISVDKCIKEFGGFDRLFRVLTLIVLTAALGLKDFGMEVKLLLPLVWLMLFCMLKLSLQADDRNLSLLGIGTFGAAVYLTRLDMVLLMLMLFPFFCYRLSFKKAANSAGFYKSVCLIFLPLAFIMVSFAAYNWFVYSIPTSISSTLKFGYRGNPIDMFRSWLLPGAGFGGIRMRFALCFYGALLYLAVYRGCIRTSVRRLSKGCLDFHELLVVLNAFSICYLTVLLLFTRLPGVTCWYMAFPLSITIVTAMNCTNILLAKVSEHYTHSFVYVTKVCLVLFIVSGVVLFKTQRLREAVAANRNQNNIAIGLWMREHLQQDAVVFQVDACGLVAYFSERAVVNGDGLINGWNYQQYLKRNALSGYLKEINVQYIVWDEFQGESSIAIPVKGTKKRMAFSAEPERIVRFGRFLLLKVDPETVVLET